MRLCRALTTIKTLKTLCRARQLLVQQTKTNVKQPRDLKHEVYVKERERNPRREGKEVIEKTREKTRKRLLVQFKTNAS